MTPLLLAARPAGSVETVRPSHLREQISEEDIAADPQRWFAPPAQRASKRAIV